MTMVHILDEGVLSLSFQESHSQQEAIHKLEREEGDQPPRRKHPQVEKRKTLSVGKP
jgi:hypothetical protein